MDSTNTGLAGTWNVYQHSLYDTHTSVAILYYIYRHGCDHIGAEMACHLKKV